MTISNARLSWLVPALLAILALFISGFTAYSSTQVDVSILQNQQKNDHERLERIERKVDEILSTIRRLP